MKISMKVTGYNKRSENCIPCERGVNLKTPMKPTAESHRVTGALVGSDSSSQSQPMMVLKVCPGPVTSLSYNL